MKNLALVTLLTAFSTLMVSAQTVEIKTVEDMISFSFETVDNLYITNTKTLTAISGFATLKEVKNDLIISDNEGITSLSGFDNLVSVKGQLSIKGNIHLTKIDGFRNLENIGEVLSISDLPATEIKGFSKLTSLEHVYLTSTFLNNVNFLSSLKKVGYFIVISKNQYLQNIDAFVGIKQAGLVEISDNKSLLNLNGLANCTKLHLFLLSNNDALLDVSGLAALDSVETSLVLYENDKISSANVLKNLLYIGADFVLDSNSSLETCSDLEALLSSGNIKGDIIMKDNLPACNKATFMTSDSFYSSPKISVYPNPSSSTTVFNLMDLNHNYDVRIYNPKGALVRDYIHVNGPIIINWNGSPSGLYFYQISSDNKFIQNGKIVLE
ncbi:MAG: T9SS type A sorting domain-containing protein [Prolixibacteraceae bacterium]